MLVTPGQAIVIIIRGLQCFAANLSFVETRASGLDGNLGNPRSGNNHHHHRLAMFCWQIFPLVKHRHQGLVAILVEHCFTFLEVSVVLIGFVHMHYHWGWLGQRQPAITHADLLMTACHVHCIAKADILIWSSHNLVSITRHSHCLLYTHAQGSSHAICCSCSRFLLEWLSFTYMRKDHLTTCVVLCKRLLLEWLSFTYMRKHHLATCVVLCRRFLLQITYMRKGHLTPFAVLAGGSF